MKRIAIFLFAILFSVTMMAKHMVYCQLTCSGNGNYFITAIVLINDKTYTFKDKNKQTQKFKTYIEVLNSMANLGWKLEPVDCPTKTSGTSFIMSKSIDSDNEIYQGLQKL